MKQRGLARLDLLQVVKRKTRQADQPRHQEQQGHRPEGGGRAAQVSGPAPGRASEQVTDEIGDDGLNDSPPGEAPPYDDASHAILPVRPAGWSRTRRPWTRVSTRR